MRAVPENVRTREEQGGGHTQNGKQAASASADDGGGDLPSGWIKRQSRANKAKFFFVNEETGERTYVT